jgi:hypothetical protein
MVEELKAALAEAPRALSATAASDEDRPTLH